MSKIEAFCDSPSLSVVITEIAERITDDAYSQFVLRQSAINLEGMWELLQEMQREDEVLLRRQAVIEMTGLSRSAIYLMMKQGRFPQSFNINARTVGWKKREIQDWIKQKTTNEDT